MANKILKTALPMCALPVIRFKGEMSAYFDRKVKEGKNKMSVLHAIVIKYCIGFLLRQRLYEPTSATVLLLFQVFDNASLKDSLLRHAPYS